jgi:hypothetical protein
MQGIDPWPNDWAASPRFSQARTFQTLSPKIEPTGALV